MSQTGKVSIRKDDLCKYSGKEHWFSLHPVDPNSEVQVILFKHMLAGYLRRYRVRILVWSLSSVCLEVDTKVIDHEGTPLFELRGCMLSQNPHGHRRLVPLLRFGFTDSVQKHNFIPISVKLKI